jgi:type I restriction enzyme M protein
MQWSIDSAIGDKGAGQFATPGWVAELLCSRLRIRPHLAVDLGVGKGALALAITQRYPDSHVVGVDNYVIPRDNQTVMGKAGVTLERRDIGAPLFSRWFHGKYGDVSTVVCNPPFTYVENKASIHQLLVSEGIHASQGAKRQRLDLIFLAHALKLLKPGGEMAFILPVSAFGMSRSIANLQAMVAHFGLTEIILLPQILYQDAEVETAILIFQTAAKRNVCDRFQLYTASSKGSINSNGQFSADDLAGEFSRSTSADVARPNSLAGLGGVIARGKHSSRILSHSGVSHFHTTSFQKYPNYEVSFEQRGRPGHSNLDEPAREGDILIPRVGTRCLGRAAIVVRGNQYISDSVFRISVPASKRRNIWEFISSEAGATWQRRLARGACAKFISQRDLLSADLPTSIT